MTTEQLYLHTVTHYKLLVYVTPQLNIEYHYHTAKNGPNCAPTNFTPFKYRLLVQTRAPPRALRSSDALMLVVPRIHTKLARRTFSVAAPSTWNSLPADIRLCENILTFKRHLKTHLFKLL